MMTAKLDNHWFGVWQIQGHTRDNGELLTVNESTNEVVNLNSQKVFGKLQIDPKNPKIMTLVLANNATCIGAPQGADFKTVLQVEWEDVAHSRKMFKWVKAFETVGQWYQEKGRSSHENTDTKAYWKPKTSGTSSNRPQPSVRELNKTVPTAYDLSMPRRITKEDNKKPLTKGPVKVWNARNDNEEQSESTSLSNMSLVDNRQNFEGKTYFAPYLTEEQCQHALHMKYAYIGEVHIARFNPVNAFVQGNFENNIRVIGAFDQNRCFEGDTVLVSLFPLLEWFSNESEELRQLQEKLNVRDDMGEMEDTQDEHDAEIDVDDTSRANAKDNKKETTVKSAESKEKQEEEEKKHVTTQEIQTSSEKSKVKDDDDISEHLSDIDNEEDDEVISVPQVMFNESDRSLSVITNTSYDTNHGGDTLSDEEEKTNRPLPTLASENLKDKNSLCLWDFTQKYSSADPNGTLELCVFLVRLPLCIRVKLLRQICGYVKVFPPHLFHQGNSAVMFIPLDKRIPRSHFLTFKGNCLFYLFIQELLKERQSLEDQIPQQERRGNKKFTSSSNQAQSNIKGQIRDIDEKLQTFILEVAYEPEWPITERFPTCRFSKALGYRGDINMEASIVLKMNDIYFDVLFHLFICLFSNEFRNPMIFKSCLHK
ncbi:hypothetical protein RFI_27438 [Reticulomyxa filosa]|uniref:Uncharacterized protein n=1 Tax=Reticulomyxa filosa TaxID=46433 RepID=X6M8J0_RETFI|nr:hypothetical protein RFI_27438 [Reticulomyxa filosa]|eukprot:ETO09941.1 hypothetical protein RFI_27438 [Reticulomyxa filosa]